MLGKGIVKLLQNSNKPHFITPKRNWTQVGIVVCIPPRNPVSYGEKVLHALFMYTVWLTPIAYWLTQVKVWRRQYVKSD